VVATSKAAAVARTQTAEDLLISLSLCTCVCAVLGWSGGSEMMRGEERECVAGCDQQGKSEKTAFVHHLLHNQGSSITKQSPAFMPCLFDKEFVRRTRPSSHDLICDHHNGFARSGVRCEPR